MATDFGKLTAALTPAQRRVIAERSAAHLADSPIVRELRKMQEMQERLTRYDWPTRHRLPVEPLRWPRPPKLRVELILPSLPPKQQKTRRRGLTKRDRVKAVARELWPSGKPKAEAAELLRQLGDELERRGIRASDTTMRRALDLRTK